MSSYNELVESQRRFFRTGTTKDLHWRKKQLKKLYATVDQNRSLLSEAIHKDLRRPVSVNEQGEVNRCLKELEYTLQNIDEWAKTEEKPQEPSGKPLVVKDPLGIVLLLCPWNYPVTLVIMPLISIIAAGNTAIVKPSEVSAHTAHVIEKVLSEAFEKEYIAVVQGGADVATQLLEESYDHIFYTGSTAVGKLVMAAAAKHLTPVTLELGGKCPVIVESDVDADTVAKRIAESKWFNNGQTCIAPDYILAHATIKAKLVESLKKAAAVTWGTVPKRNPEYSRVVSLQHFDRLKSMLDATKARLLYKAGELDRDDCFIPPIILEATADDAVMKDEVFGPILPVLTVADFEEALEFMNSREKPLGAYLFTKDEAKVLQFLRDTSSGGVTINGVSMQAGAQTLPFGGVGFSGMGHYHGKYGFDTFSHEKAVLTAQL